MGATVSIYLDLRIKKTDDLYPVKIRVTHERQRQYLSLPKDRINSKLEGSSLAGYKYHGLGDYSMDEKLFNKMIKAQKGQLKELQIIFDAIRLDVQSKADSLNPFTFDGLKVLLNRDKKKIKTVFILFDQIIDELKQENRIGTANSYRDASSSLKNFSGVMDVPFEYFTNKKLEEYYNWFVDNGKKSDTSAGMYLRALRVVYNRAIAEKYTTFYPFNRGISKEEGKFQIPKGGGRKIALNKTEIEKLFSFSLPEKHNYSFFFDCWKIMYMTGGINPIDLCLLKDSNIQGNFVCFIRHKTKRTNRQVKTIKVPLSPYALELINKWNKDRSNGYLLPVLSTNMTPEEIKVKVHLFVSSVNKACKAVAKVLAIDKKITTYVARHSIATQLLQSGASVKFIGDQLGHTSVATTEAYLEGFSDDQMIKEYSNIIPMGAQKTPDNESAVPSNEGM